MKTILTVFLFFNSLIGICQLNENTIKGYYGGNIKVRANISGTITTSAIKRKPSLSERGINKIAILTNTKDDERIQNVGITIVGNSYDSLSFSNYLPQNFLDSIFVDFIENSSNLILHKLNAEEKHKLLSFFNKGKIWKNPDALNLLNSYKNDIDGIIYINEVELPDFFYATIVRLASKGIYNNKRAKGKCLVYSGFEISIIDINTGKIIKSGEYTQASADYLPFELETGQSNFTKKENEIIIQILKERYLNNARESLSMFKVIK